jgi:serine/threonine-protein kinase
MPGDEFTIDIPTRNSRVSSDPAQRIPRRTRTPGSPADRTGVPTDRDARPLLETTDDYSSAGKAANEPARERAVVDASRALSSSETRDILCARLNLAVRMLALILGLFLARALLLPDRDPAMLLAQTWVILALGIVHTWLANERGLSARQLRVLELALFGLVAALLATGQYRQMLDRYRQGDETRALSAMNGGVLVSLVLMTTYGLFIPNGWRRAALVVAPIALMPIGVAWLLLARHPELSGFAARFVGFEQSSDHAVMLLIGAVLSVFGTPIVVAACARVSESHHLGPYHLRERIGTGGMGEVYLAEHQFLKRPCAIKLIRPGKAADPRALARFEREVHTTAQLSHWNTVEIYDYGRTEDGTFFYVMEYLPGLSLAELVERHGPLPPERVIHLLRQACRALEEAHGLGLIHRDLKPANLFAAHRGGLHDVTKILDFGLAKRQVETPAMQLSHHGSITGSPLYMSPEQASGQRADHRSDIYSLGAVAYCLLTGQAPFRGDNALSVMIAHARDPANPPTALRPDIPQDLERVVLRCLAKDPGDRYQDAASLGRALADCASADLWTERRAAEWWRASGEAAGAVQGVASRQVVGYSC